MSTFKVWAQDTRGARFLGTGTADLLRVSDGGHCIGEAKLMADNVSFNQCPVIVTDGPPLIVVIDLHTSSRFVAAVHQLHRVGVLRDGRTEHACVAPMATARSDTPARLLALEYTGFCPGTHHISQPDLNTCR